MAKPNLDDVTEREFTFVLQEFGLRRANGICKELSNVLAEIKITNKDGETWDGNEGSNDGILQLIEVLIERNVEYQVTVRGTEKDYKFCKKAIEDYTGPYE
jgi:hypothetical protein